MNAAAFQALLSDRSKSVISDFSSDSDVMLIAFGGIAGELSMPAFEFFRLTSSFPTKKLYARDLRQAWYQRGLVGIGETPDEITHYLLERIRENRVRRVITVGNSMGGFASLLFGWLIEADEVHSFSPQTFLTRTRRILHWDFRWKRRVAAVHRSPKLIHRYLDLRPLLASRRTKTRFHIYFSEEGRLDRAHADHLGDHPQVRLHRFQEGGHGMVRYLRDTGALERILLHSISGMDYSAGEREHSFPLNSR